MNFFMMALRPDLPVTDCQVIFYFTGKFVPFRRLVVVLLYKDKSVKVFS